MRAFAMKVRQVRRKLAGRKKGMKDRAIKRAVGSERVAGEGFEQMDAGLRGIPAAQDRENG